MSRTHGRWLSAGVCALALAAPAAAQADLPPIAEDGRIYYTDVVGLSSSPTTGQESAIFSARPDGSDPQQLTREFGVERFPKVSPDGKQLAYLDGAGQLHVMPSIGGPARVLGVYGRFAWSPDSRKLVAAESDADGGVSIVMADGGSSWEIADEGEPITWVRDVDRIVLRDGAEHVSIRPDGSDAEPLDLGAPDATRVLLDISPDAREALIARRPAGNPEGCVDAYLFDLVTKAERRVTENHLWERYGCAELVDAGAWSPSGGRFAVSFGGSASSDGGVQVGERAAGSAAQVAGSASRSVSWGPKPPPSVRPLDLRSEDMRGRIYFTSLRDQMPLPDPNPYGRSAAELYSARPDGSGLERLTFSRANEEGVDVSPDGRYVAYSAEGVFVKPATGGPATQVDVSGTFVWAPDSRALLTPRDGGIVAVRIDGSGTTKISETGTPVATADAAGRVMILDAGRYWTMRGDGSDRRPTAVPGTARVLDLSPDGRRALVQKRPEGIYTDCTEFYDVDVSTGVERQMTQQTTNPGACGLFASTGSWSPSGERFVGSYVSTEPYTAGRLHVGSRTGGPFPQIGAGRDVVWAVAPPADTPPAGGEGDGDEPGDGEGPGHGDGDGQEQPRGEDPPQSPPQSPPTPPTPPATATPAAPAAPAAPVAGGAPSQSTPAPKAGRKLKLTVTSRRTGRRTAVGVMTWLAKGEQLVVRCAGGRCKMASRTLKATRSGTRRLTTARLPRGAKLTVLLRRDGKRLDAYRITVRKDGRVSFRRLR